MVESEATLPVSSAIVTRRSFIASGAMALTAAGAYAMTPHQIAARAAHGKLGGLIAKQIGPWVITNPAGVVVPNDESENTDGYDQVLTRVYRAPDLPSVMMCIAYGSAQAGTLRLHRPETCYPSQGFALSGFVNADVRFPGYNDVAIRRFTAQREDRVERVLYWTRIGEQYPLDISQEYSAIFHSVLRGSVPDGILVRLSAIEPDIARSDEALTDFAQAMVQTARPLGRQLLLGPAAARAV